MRRLLPNIEYHLLGGQPYKSVIVYDVTSVWCANDGTLIDLTASGLPDTQAGKSLPNVCRSPRPA